MERQRVDSFDIESIGYDQGSEILEIEFKSGSIYQYSGVPIGKFDDLMSANSHGRYFNSHIKNDYGYRKI